MKRAQTATEYMIILAIVIIIALIVAAVLGQFPTMGGASRARASTIFWQSTDIGIVAYSIAEDGDNDDITLRLRNNRKDTMVITTILFDDTTIVDEEYVIAPGEVVTIFSGIDTGSFCNRPGDMYTVEVTIDYIDDETGETFTFTGSGNKLEGKCAN